ncbi:MAG: response regulator transcription factor [Caldilineaceae bacterium]|nr:response regulator transcription factor [Caldilineaceae bacterium]
MVKQLLIVDDDSLMRRSLSATLDQAGYATRTAASAADALHAVHLERPDLVLLDIGLPDMDGLETLRSLRAVAPNLPVIFVTARRRELDEIVGLELGADDYITKPFDMDVLLAHVRAVLRRAAPPETGAQQEPLTVGSLRIDPAGRVVSLDQRTVELAPREFDLLLLLAQYAGRVLSNDDLLAQVWGPEWIGESQTLYVHIRWLREKLEEDPAHPRRILTVRGAGYKLVAA